MTELARAVLVALGLLAPQPAANAALDATSSAAAPTFPALESIVQPDPPYDDRWLGEDKFRHFWASYAVTAFGFAAAAAAEQDRDAALLIGIGAGATAGVAKELYDRRRTIFSVRDLVADALGITAAYFLLREIR